MVSAINNGTRKINKNSKRLLLLKILYIYMALDGEQMGKVASNCFRMERVITYLYPSKATYLRTQIMGHRMETVFI